MGDPDTVHPSTRIRRQRKADGRCVNCGVQKTGADVPFFNCRRCRIVLSAKLAAKRAQRKM